MSEFNPKVSIVIPVYNGADYLREAIDSALAQTYTNMEVIVVNDGSTDGGATEEIALSYGDRIRYFRKENGGVSSALNRGIREMTGDYFSWLSHDDVYYPNKIAAQVEVLCHEPPGTIVYSDYDFIDSESRYLRTRNIAPIEPDRMRPALITSDPVNGCTVLIPKGCFDTVGLFAESMKSTQDYHLWFRLAKEYPFVHGAGVLLKSRIHPVQGTHTLANHNADETSLFIWCMNEFTVDEIAAYHPSAALFYLGLALNLVKRQYHQASLHAVKLGVKQVKQQPLYCYPRFVVVLIWYLLLTILIKLIK